MIYIVRHGETEWNKLNKLMGRCDISLNEEGFEQAEKLSDTLKNLDFDFIITSPLKRTIQTADVISKAKNVPIILDKRLEERNFGELRGLNPLSIDYKSYWDYYRNKPLMYGEDMKTFFKRIYGALDDIVEKYQGINILLVLHYGVSIPVSCYFTEIIPPGSLIDYKFGLKNCEVKAYGSEIRRKIR